jgi:hypothetical protein
MSNKRILNAVGQVDDDYVVESIPRKQIRKRSHWIKWCAMAASFALIISISIPFISRIITKDPTETEIVLEYNNAYYSIVDMDKRDTLKAYNLPYVINDSMIGQYVSTTVTEEGSSGFIYEYNITTNNKQSAVYIYKEEEDYTFILFANYLDKYAKESSEMLSVYGIGDASDIAEIIVGKERITNKDTIENFYQELIKAESMNEDEYQLSVFQRKSEAEQQQIAAHLAKEALAIKIVTKEGLVANWITYHPSISFIDWGTYHYRISDMPF